MRKFLIFPVILILLFLFQKNSIFAASTITFNDITQVNTNLQNTYPAGVIDWGNNRWYTSGPWGAFTTNSISFANSTSTSEQFTFLSPSVLHSVEAYNGGTTSTTITLSCSGNPTVTRTLLAGQTAIITTSWQNTCTGITIGSSNTWETNFDNLVYDSTPAAPTSSASASPTVAPTTTPIPTSTPIPVGTPVSGVRWNGNQVYVDSSGKLLSWRNQTTAYHDIVLKAWEFISTKIPVAPNGVKMYLSYCCFQYPNFTFGSNNGFHNPAGLYAMMTDSLVLYYQYTGEEAAKTLVQEMLDYEIANGTSPANWNWPNMPFASAVHGDTIYRGDRSNERDGANGIEPDKSAEIAYSYLDMWKLTGQTKYRDAALAVANTLASKHRAGDSTRSPWPFRVDAQTGAINEEYTSHQIPMVRLFDELIRLNLGNVSLYQTVRNQTWNWLLTYPLQNNLWTAYFEDIQRDPSQWNYNQVSPMETARYIMSRPNPATVDPNWQTRVPTLLTWVKNSLGRGPFYGAQAIDEQRNCCSPWGLGSHTARWASINALFYEKTGNNQYKEEAYRAFNYATYLSDPEGYVKFAFDYDYAWFTDGYGDYIRHFLWGMGSVPEWIPDGQNHVFFSSTVISSISYQPNIISYRTFDSSGEQKIKLAFTPSQVTVNGSTIPHSSSGQGWSYNSQTRVLTVRHTSGNNILVTSGQAPTATPVSCPTDINDDTITDLTDYSILATNFLMAPPLNPRTDINRDGITDLTDYSLLATQFLRPCN